MAALGPVLIIRVTNVLLRHDGLAVCALVYLLLVCGHVFGL